MTLDLFHGDVRYSDSQAIAERLYTTWRDLPECKPGWDTPARARVVRQRIREAIDDGWSCEVILAALDRAWNFKAPRPDGSSAWQTALSIAAREERKASEPRLTSTQAAILRVAHGAAAG